MRRFGTQGPVHPEKNYVVSRAAEIADFVMRVKEGRYIVIFAPRQTGKTTFFQRALDVFAAEEPAYFPIPLNFDIPKIEPITMAHFATAHAQLLEKDNVNLTHLLTNIRRDRRFETLLMKIASYDIGIPFTRHDEIMNELATYGVIKESTDGMCEILNPIYFYCILRAFNPIVNGLEQEYFRQEVRD